MDKAPLEKINMTEADTVILGEGVSLPLGLSIVTLVLTYQPHSFRSVSTPVGAESTI